MRLLSRVLRRAIEELSELKERGREQDSAVEQALTRARQERVNLQVAVQSRRWSSTR